MPTSVPHLPTRTTTSCLETIIIMQFVTYFSRVEKWDFRDISPTDGGYY